MCDCTDYVARLVGATRVGGQRDCSERSIVTVHASLPWIEEEIGTPAFLQDPYPVYSRLREERPITWSSRWNAWLVTRYDDVLAMLGDTKRFSNRARFDNFIDRAPEESRGEFAPLQEHVSLGLANMDPPDHSRLRALANKVFHPRAIEQLRPRVEAIVSELLDAVEGAGRIDIVRDLAFPLPAILISEILGVPAEDRQQFHHWVEETAFHGGADVEGDQTLVVRMRRANDAVVALTGWLRPQFEERRRRPTDDLLSGLVAAEKSDSVLSDAELVTMCILLVRAGHITTQGLIGNGVHALLRDPAQRAAVIDDPDVMGNAVEEFLRYDTPFLRTLRRVTEDVEYCGEELRAGDIVSLMLGAANRDPAHWPDPERCDVTRPRRKHLAFGYGVHFCLGAPLARLETEVAVAELLRRWPGLYIDDGGGRYMADNVMHCFESLPVVLTR